jgi:hypothetical protein
MSEFLEAVLHLDSGYLWGEVIITMEHKKMMTRTAGTSLLIRGSKK